MSGAVTRAEYETRVVMTAITGVLFMLFVGTSARSDKFSPDRFGIGATLVQPEDSTFIRVGGCAPNGPAAHAGLEAGDRILELDGRSVHDWKLERLTDYLIRSKPLPLRITVQRGKDVITVELVRMRIADIAAENGFRWTADSTFGYRMIPLDARPEVEIGEVVPLDSIRAPTCGEANVSPSNQVTVLYFWTAWCAPCKILFRELRNQPGHRLIAISLDRTCEDFQSAVTAHDPPGEEFWAGGWYAPISQSLGVYRRGVPTAAVIDPDGRLIAIETGVDPIMKMIAK